MIETSTSTGSSFGFGITVLKPFLAFGTLCGTGRGEDEWGSGAKSGGPKGGADGDNSGDSEGSSSVERDPVVEAARRDITSRRVAMGDPLTDHSVMPSCRR